MSDMFVASLQNRIRALNTIWERAVSDLTLEQMNHHERAGVLPMAFSFSHYIRAQDQSISGPFLRQPTLWDQGGWASKIGVTVDALGREETVEEMEHIRFADIDAWKAYQAQVLERTRGVLDTLTADMLGEVLMPQAAADAAAGVLRHRHRAGRAAAKARGAGVLRVPAWPAAHGRDRAWPRARRPEGHDELIRREHSRQSRDGARIACTLKPQSTRSRSPAASH